MNHLLRLQIPDVIVHNGPRAAAMELAVPCVLSSLYFSMPSAAVAILSTNCTRIERPSQSPGNVPCIISPTSPYTTTISFFADKSQALLPHRVQLRHRVAAHPPRCHAKLATVKHARCQDVNSPEPSSVEHAANRIMRSGCPRPRQAKQHLELESPSGDALLAGAWRGVGMLERRDFVLLFNSIRRAHIGLEVFTKFDQSPENHASACARRYSSTRRSRIQHAARADSRNA